MSAGFRSRRKFFDSNGSDSEIIKTDTGSVNLPQIRFAPVVKKQKKGEN
jgi:hypothetical protein